MKTFARSKAKAEREEAKRLAERERMFASFSPAQMTAAHELLIKQGQEIDRRWRETARKLPWTLRAQIAWQLITGTI